MIIPQTKGQLTAKLDSLWVKHPRADNAFAIFDDIRERKRLSGPRCEAVGATLLAPSRSGKSRTVEHYITTRIVQECISRGLIPDGASLEDAVAEQKLVVHITLSSPTSVGALMSDLLAALGDLHPQAGTVSSRRHRVYTLLRKHKTELLFFDEVQHLGREMDMAASSRRESASVVQNNLKTFLLNGFPVVFLGLDEAREKIFSDVQISLRIAEEIDFSPLNYRDAADTQMVLDFCARLAGKLYREEVFDHVVDLISDDLPECFCDACKGRLGLVAELVRWASILAFQERAHTLTRAHFARAVDKHLLGKDGFDSNPFANDNTPDGNDPNQSQILEAA